MGRLKSIGFRSSEVLKIMATIVEIMEESNFFVDHNCQLNPSSTKGFYNMSFPKGITTFDDLYMIQKKLGEDFTITIVPTDKSSLNVCLEGSKAAFGKIIGLEIQEEEEKTISSGNEKSEN